MKNKKSIFHALENSFSLFPDREAVYDGERRMTYTELYQEVNCLAAALQYMGIQKGNKVIVCLPNWHEFVVIYFALAKIGAVLIPGNPNYKNKEWDNILRFTQIAAVFCSKIDKISEYHDNLIKEKLMCKIDHIITVRFSLPQTLNYQELLQQGEKLLENASPVKVDDDQVFAILYTSGSTGIAKSVMLTHANFIYSAANVTEILECTEQDIHLVPVPFSHVFGLIPGILAVIMSGGKMVLMQKYRAAEAITLIQEEKTTVHYGVPTMFILELNHPWAATANFSSLRTGIIAGAPCPEQVIHKIRSVMGCHIIVSYGATETSAGVTYTGLTDDVGILANTVGRVVRGTEIKIVNEDRNIVPIGEVGELACRGKGVMKGYVKAPEADHSALDGDGWFYTGDLAQIDKAGYVSIVGRKKDMIIRGGYNIYPRKLEEIYYTHPHVAQISVVGIPNSIYGEATCAVIRLSGDGHGEDEESMKNFIRDKVAKYEVPDHVLFVEDFVLSQTGKINKKALRELCIGELNCAASRI